MTPEEIKQLKRENAKLRKALNEALELIKDLQAQVNQTSRNSGWPSSRDKSRKKRSSKSLREKSNKKAGGQVGHEGETLEFSKKVDRVKKHRPTACAHCQSQLSKEQEAHVFDRRQVLDLPPIELEVTEHQVEAIVCDCCGQITVGEFPVDVTNPVQYGPRVRALAVYLKAEHFLPYKRSQRLLSDLFGAKLSPGTLQNAVHKAGEQLKAVSQKIQEGLLKHDVLHFDESGFYIAGEREWLHVASSPTLTLYKSHPKRGRVAVNEIGLLPKFSGTAIHDNWSTYWSYEQCSHALCNVHHLRELNAVTERFEQPWASRFKQFLLAIKSVVDAAKKAEQSQLPPHKLVQIERIYRRLISAALAANPPPPDGWPRSQRGRPKKTKARNLAERLDLRRHAVLAFAYDFNIPFDNNLAERDIRMLKVQQKISGCFRSQEGADSFCTIRSYLSSLRKQAFNLWDALCSLFSQRPLVQPSYTPV